MTVSMNVRSWGCDSTRRCWWIWRAWRLPNDVLNFQNILKCFCVVFHVFNFCRWIEACIGESLPPTVELEESLRNGVALGKLAHFMAPELVPLRKVYDKDLSRYNVSMAVRADWINCENTLQVVKRFRREWFFTCLSLKWESWGSLVRLRIKNFEHLETDSWTVLGFPCSGLTLIKMALLLHWFNCVPFFNNSLEVYIFVTQTMSTTGFEHLRRLDFRGLVYSKFIIYSEMWNLIDWN